MKKYIYITKTEIVNNLQYIFDTLVSFISFAVIIYIYLNLWKYMYSDNSSLINGYSFNQMIWYVLVTEVLWMSLGGRKLCAAIADDVKDGTVAYKINKPFNYILYNVSKHMGLFIYRFVVYVFLSFILGYVLLGSFLDFNIIHLLLVLISSLLATVISVLIITSIGLLSFFIEDANPIYWVYSKVILVVGTLFPIEFFPKVIQPIITYSPIYVVSYGPAKLFVDFSKDVCLNVFLSQIVYLLITYIICSIIYRRGVKKINVNGG